jgi:crotonobetainyl-CoA:carnitine CoA-transferase CaiB-like acyl-CoA transferase
VSDSRSGASHPRGEAERDGIRLPLTGLRVVDTSDRTALSAARLLADLGADVIRVEQTVRPLDPLTASRNANKRVTVLADADRLRRLLDEADVWFDTGGSGLDARTAHRELPDLVIVSLSPFGPTGPYRDFAATHPVLYALSGQLKLCRKPGRPPVVAPGLLVFEVASAMAAYLALVAVWNRCQNGVGDHVELSMHEAYIQTMDTALAGASIHDLVSNAPGQRRAGHPAFPTQDGLVRPLVVSSHQWQALREWLGNPPELDDDELSTYVGRLRHPDVLAKVYAELFAGTITETICDEAQRRNVPATPVMSPAQLLASDPMARRGTFADISVEGKRGRLPAGYWEFDDVRIGFRAAADKPGPDCDAVVTALARGESPFSGPRFSVAPRAASGEAPLNGLCVLEFTQLMAGPEAGRLLRDHGADVIKVESRVFPDQSRVFGGAANVSSQFVTINRDKRSVGIDLRKPEGRALALQLVAGADVVIENLGPGVMDNIGLGVDALREANPGIVVVSSQLFGDRGPWGWWRGFGSHARSVGGQTWLWRYPDGDHEFAEDAIFFPDQFAGRLQALAALAAVGAGASRHVRVAQADAVINSLSELLLEESLAPGTVDPAGNRSRDGSPGGVYRCAGEDDWCVITIRDDRDWAALVDTMGRPAWALDERYAQAAGRHGLAEQLDERVGAWTATMGSRDVMERLQRAGVPAAAVLAPVDLLGDPHLLSREFIQVIVQPGFDSILADGDCYTAEHLPKKQPGPAPRQGQHTREIAQDILGLAPMEIDFLIEAGVLETDGGESCQA